MLGTKCVMTKMVIMVELELVSGKLKSRGRKLRPRLFCVSARDVPDMAAADQGACLGIRMEASLLLKP